MENKKKDAEKKRVEALNSTAFGKYFIDPETGRINKALAWFLFVGMLAGAVIGEWYGITNGWPVLRRKILFFHVTWGLLIGVFCGVVVGLVSYKIFKCFRR